MILFKLKPRASSMFTKGRSVLFTTTSTQLNSKKTQSASIDLEDVKRLANLSSVWWDPNGTVKGLHTLNNLRVKFFKNGLLNDGNVNDAYKDTQAPLEGLTILEVGCGAGVLSEAMGRLHANMVAIDPGTEIIETAQQHVDLDKHLSKRIKYIAESIEDHSIHNQNKYDAVIISEVLEHVYEHDLFLKACVSTLKPGGSIFITTFHKTFLSWLFCIKCAENLTSFAPVGLHDWNKFISPMDTQRILRKYKCSTVLLDNFRMVLWNTSWKWTKFKQFSYALQAIKRA